MGIYLNLNYRTRKRGSSNTENLMVILNYFYNGKKLRKSLGIKVLLKDWNEDSKENPVRKTDPDHRSKNLLLKEKLLEMNKIVQRIELQGQLPTVELVEMYVSKLVEKKMVETKKEYGFSTLLDEYILDVKKDIRLSNNYLRTLINSLEQVREFVDVYSGGRYFNIGEIDEDFQRDYLNYSTKSKNRLPSTTNKHLRCLRGFIRWCHRNGFCDKVIEGIKINTTFDKEIIFLNRAELLQLSEFTEFDFTNDNHSKYTNEYFSVPLKNGKYRKFTNLEVYKDMLIFGCGLGCRFGDLIKLKIDNYHFDDTQKGNGYFVFRMEKSNVGKKVRVPINQLTFNIWKKYSSSRTREDFIFPPSQRGCLVSNQKFNQHIKEIGRIVGLNRRVSKPSFTTDGKVVKGTDIREPLYKFISSHIMRRTFIREGINNNLPYHIIMSMSGHSSEQIFRGYFNTTEEELKVGGSKMFSIGEISPPNVVNTETTDILSYLNQMDDEKKKLFVELLKNFNK